MNPDLSTAVAHLRMRACWTEVPVLLRGEEGFDPLFETAAALVERCAFTNVGWEEAAEALRVATAAATTDEERARVTLEDAFFCYARTVFADDDHAAEAKQKLDAAAELAAPDSPLRPLLAFRRGLMTENLDGQNDTARGHYLEAHEVAVASGDELFQSFTIRHLAILDRKAGDFEQARVGFAESLRLRVGVGFLIGLAPGLSGLARVSDEPEASRLRAESARLVQALSLAERLCR